MPARRLLRLASLMYMASIVHELACLLVDTGPFEEALQHFTRARRPADASCSASATPRLPPSTTNTAMCAPSPWRGAEKRWRTARPAWRSHSFKPLGNRYVETVDACCASLHHDLDALE